MSKYVFSRAPRANIPRSAFDRSHRYTTSMDSGYLVPFYVDEVLPGDTIAMDKVSFFSRLLSLQVPIMDNLYLDWFFFFVPNRIVWKHWKAMQGEQAYPDSKTDYLTPKITAPAGGWPIQSLADYLGIRPLTEGITTNALAFRAYNLIFDTWFRDENLVEPTNMAKEESYGDGPDNPADYVVRKSGKRHDYFTSCLPWPQKGEGVLLPLGSTAPVIGNGMTLGFDTGTSSVPHLGLLAGDGSLSSAFVGNSGVYGQPVNTNPSGTGLAQGHSVGVTTDPTKSGLIADLSSATAALVTTVRDAFQVQKILERDARGGTRYVEILQSHFGVTSPDSRLQNPELLDAGSCPVMINTVAQTSSSVSDSPQANLAAYGVIAKTTSGFTKSFVEHGYVMGICRIRADLSYQQGTPRHFFNSERFDYYMPELACISEQAVLNREIFTQGSGVKDDNGDVIDEKVFGYQEAWAHYRYFPNQITGKLRSDDPQSLDAWHLAQDFAELPTLSEKFITEDIPLKRALAVQDEPEFKLDVQMSVRWVRPMPLYSVPGLVDHF